jgi:hypothetical protein
MESSFFGGCYFAPSPEAPGGEEPDAIGFYYLRLEECFADGRVQFVYVIDGTRFDTLWQAYGARLCYDFSFACIYHGVAMPECFYSFALWCY